MNIVDRMFWRGAAKAPLGLPICLCTLAFLLSTGCASMQKALTPEPEISASRTEGSDLSTMKKFYIAQENDLNKRQSKTFKAVQNALTAHGAVEMGPPSEMPTDTECRVDVECKWFWDLGWYLLKLKINLYDARTGELIGSGSSRRADPAIRRKPDFMANEVLDAIYHASP